ncbi:hypothetical protein CIG19_07880 [Enterobacterales bacterium CwR94]|nr:hypothetical protein CIG19_07880 [Enterobacterales bacterium CwR94]
MWKRVRQFRKNLLTLWYAVRHPRTPLWIKGAMAAIALYVVSPVDIIPDVIPLVGWLDDALLVPLGIGFLLKFVPDEVLLAANRPARTATAAQKAAGFKPVLIGLLCVWAILVAWALWAGK